MSRPLALPLALTLALASLLALAGCGDKQPAIVNESAGDASLAEENVVAGDVTAIDAATADDARMADDLPPPLDDGNETNLSNEAEQDGNEA